MSSLLGYVLAGANLSAGRLLRLVDAPRKPVLVVEHVAWEGPHRIADSFVGPAALRTVRPLKGESLPAPEEVAGAIVMGGPMNVDDVQRYPALADERCWIERQP